MQLDSLPASATDRVRWPAVAYALIVLAACVFAFVGLDRSNFWTDELFTLHVIGHDGGLGEVWRRALTDTHPPLYYFGLYGWSKLGGISELWLRLPSAVFAVLALAVTAAALWRRFSPAAIGFALATASVSMFWFEQSQNARSYSLSMLLSAGLLATALKSQDRWLADRRPPWLLLSLMFLLGLAASLTHFYLLLGTGMVLAWVLWVVPDWRARAAVVLAGVFILALSIAYVWALLHSTMQNVHGGLWFDTGLKFFWKQTRHAERDLATIFPDIALALLVISALWQRSRRRYSDSAARVTPAGRTAAQLALLVGFGVIVAGIVVSYALAPSYSDRNLLTISPFWWVLLAWLYEVAGPRQMTRRGQAMALLLVTLVACNLVLLPGRFQERNEVWRNSAEFVSRMPGCQALPVAVMQPYKFGPSTPFFRELAANDFFGHYAAPGTVITSWLPSELTGRRFIPELSVQLEQRARNAQSGGCTLLVWGVHDLKPDDAETLAQDLAAMPGIAPRRVVVQTFLRADRIGAIWKPVSDGFVFYALPPLAAGAPLKDPGAAVPMADGILGDRYVATLEGRVEGRQGPGFNMDVLSLQRYSYKDSHVVERFDLVPRLTCSPVQKEDEIDPVPSYPGCFARPLEENLAGKTKNTPEGSSH